MSNIRACGHILDMYDNAVVGKVYFYVKTDEKGHFAVTHEDTKVPVGPGGVLYTYTDKNCDAVPGKDPGWFDMPDGMPEGEYALHVHHGNGKKEWAWPFIVKDGKPQKVYIGGSVSTSPGPLPADYPIITPLNKQFVKGNYTASFSYYGMLFAPIDRIKRDLDKFRRAGFGNARVWIDWNYYEKNGKIDDNSARAIDKYGNFVEENADKLDEAMKFAASIGMSFDLTMHASAYKYPEPTDSTSERYEIDTHKNGLRNLLTRWGKNPALRIVDVGNEGEVRGKGGHGSPDTGHVSPARFAELMGVARSIPRTCLVGISVSPGGDYNDVVENYVAMFRDTKGEILLPHFERNEGWGAEEGKKGIELSKKIPGIIWHHQEPARNGHTSQPGMWPLSEFEKSFKTTRASGAVGCCLHGDFGFDLRTKDAWDQLDSVEKQVVSNVLNWIK